MHQLREKFRTLLPYLASWNSRTRASQETAFCRPRDVPMLEPRHRNREVRVDRCSSGLSSCVADGRASVLALRCRVSASG